MSIPGGHVSSTCSLSTAPQHQAGRQLPFIPLPAGLVVPGNAGGRVTARRAHLSGTLAEAAAAHAGQPGLLPRPAGCLWALPLLIPASNNVKNLPVYRRLPFPGRLQCPSPVVREPKRAFQGSVNTQGRRRKHARRKAAATAICWPHGHGLS